MAYGHLNEVCAPRRKRYEEWFHKRLIRYHTVMVILTTLYRRGELSLCTWYRAERIAAERSKLPEDSIYRLWHPDYGTELCRATCRAVILLIARHTKQIKTDCNGRCCLMRSVFLFTESSLDLCADVW